MGKSLLLGIMDTWRLQSLPKFPCKEALEGFVGEVVPKNSGQMASGQHYAISLNA